LRCRPALLLWLWSRLLLRFWPRLSLRFRSRLWLRCRPHLRRGPLYRLRTRLRLRHRFRLRLFRPRLLRPHLRLSWANLRLGGPRLLRANLGLSRPVLRLYRSSLGFARSDWLHLRTVIWFAWTIFRLTGTSLWLTGPGRLNLRAIVRLTRTIPGLPGAICFAWTSAWLARTVSRSRPGDAGLRGDWSWSCNHCRSALIHVVELLTVLCCLTLVL
jgi:hypothetical protein